MKKGKLASLVSLLLIGTIVLTGCGSTKKVSKSEPTGEEFSKTFKDAGFDIIDHAYSDTDTDVFKTSTVAVKDNNYEVLFFKLKDEKTSKSMFNSEKEFLLEVESIEDIKKPRDGCKVVTKSLENLEHICIISDMNTSFLYRIGTTMVYYVMPTDLEDEIKETNELLKSMGY